MSQKVEKVKKGGTKTENKVNNLNPIPYVGGGE